MAISQKKLVELLNKDLELEYSAAIQYINHSAVMTGAIPGPGMPQSVSIRLTPNRRRGGGGHQGDRQGCPSRGYTRNLPSGEGEAMRRWRPPW